MLRLSRDIRDRMVAHCLDGYPLEACGLLAGEEEPALGEHRAEEGTQDADQARGCYPTDNTAASSRVYEVDPRQMLRADRDAEDRGWKLIGVWHSHTHTEAYPSPTDIGQAPDPDWHYVIVSLRDVEPSLRSYRIRGGKVEEELVVVQ